MQNLPGGSRTSKPSFAPTECAVSAGSDVDHYFFWAKSQASTSESA